MMSFNRNASFGSQKGVVMLQRARYSLRDIQKRLKEEGTNVSL